MSHETLLRDLKLWRELGWIRIVDEHLACFLSTLEPDADEKVLLAGAMTSHLLGKGHVCLGLSDWLDDPLAALPGDELVALNQTLSKTLLAVIRARGARPFGICRTCRHHQRVGDGGYCRLLAVALEPIETGQICHEHDPVGPPAGPGSA